MYELYDPCTVMFFFRNKHIMIDLGTGNNNKINWAMNNKQEFIDIVEVVYRGARKGRGLVVSPKGECLASVRAGFKNMCTLEALLPSEVLFIAASALHCSPSSSCCRLLHQVQVLIKEKSQTGTSSAGRSQTRHTCNNLYNQKLVGLCCVSDKATKHSLQDSCFRLCSSGLL